MVSKINPFTLFRNQYFLFITTVVLTIIINQAIIQYNLNQQNEDAQLINTAGRQRMLCQRISKVVLYIEDDYNAGGISFDSRVDTLSSLINQFENVHYDLLMGKDSDGNTYSKSEVTDA